MSLRGRHTHAARQRRYRFRQTKVTHQGSPLEPSSDLLPVNPALRLEIKLPLAWHCHFCGRLQVQFVRHDFLRRRIRRPLRLPDRREPPHEYDP